MPEDYLEFDPHADYCEFCGEDLDLVRVDYPPSRLLLEDGTYMTIKYASAYVSICWICLESPEDETE